MLSAGFLILRSETPHLTKTSFTKSVVTHLPISIGQKTFFASFFADSGSVFKALFPYFRAFNYFLFGDGELFAINFFLRFSALGADPAL